MSVPSMSHRHYVFIAGVIARLPQEHMTRVFVADEFARALRGTNVAFDVSRFLDAALGSPGGRDRAR